MVYKVFIEIPAREDALDYARYMIDETRSIEPAQKWLERLEASIETLSELPLRHPVIPEQDQFSIELRQFMHFSHRVIFYVNESSKSVHVVRIYHERRDELRRGEI